MICKTDISNLKTDILEKVGQKIIVKGSLGRSRTFEKEATIEKAYPNIVVVRYEENNRNVTYSYTDVLTRTVEVDSDSNVEVRLKLLNEIGTNEPVITKFEDIYQNGEDAENKDANNNEKNYTVTKSNNSTQRR